MYHDPKTSKNTDMSNTYPPQDTTAWHWTKFKSVRFEDPYEHINPMENANYVTHLLYTHVEHNIEYS